MSKKEVNTPNTKRKLFFGLFVFPLLIAVAMAVLLSAIVFLTKEEETPETLIKAIKTGAPSKRWQKAFELSNELNHKNGMIRSAGIKKEIIHILNDRDHYDAKTRAYMAMALSRFQDEETLDALLTTLRGLEVGSEDESEFVIFLMWAIGNYQNPEAADDVAGFLQNKQGDVRKTAAYVLGVLGNRKSVKVLLPLLEDSVHDVAWNAALSLARLGSDAGWKVLLQMLDRNYLKQAFQMNDAQVDPVVTNAAKGFTLIKKQEAVPILEKVSKEDPSLKVREAALNALEFQK